MVKCQAVNLESESSSLSPGAYNPHTYVWGLIFLKECFFLIQYKHSGSTKILQPLGKQL
jgi:hypothetical protein